MSVHRTHDIRAELHDRWYAATELRYWFPFVDDPVEVYRVSETVRGVDPENAQRSFVRDFDVFYEVHPIPDGCVVAPYEEAPVCPQGYTNHCFWTQTERTSIRHALLANPARTLQMVELVSEHVTRLRFRAHDPLPQPRLFRIGWFAGGRWSSARVLLDQDADTDVVDRMFPNAIPSVLRSNAQDQRLSWIYPHRNRDASKHRKLVRALARSWISDRPNPYAPLNDLLRWSPSEAPGYLSEVRPLRGDPISGTVLLTFQPFAVLDGITGIFKKHPPEPEDA